MKRAWGKRYSIRSINPVNRGAMGELYYNKRLDNLANLLELGDPDTPTRLAAKERLAQLSQEINPDLCVVMANGRLIKILYFYSADGRTHFFIKKNKLEGIVSKSTIYASRERAFTCYKNDWVNWVEHHRLPSVSP